MVTNLKIGVFDSGIGGLAIAKAIKKSLPDVTVIRRSDKAHFPYGDRPLDDIYGFTKPLLEELVGEGCQVIVVACNTVTTNFINRLRTELPVPLIGIEPMIKPAAALTKSHVIAVCATPRTLSSARYTWLKQEFAKGIKVIEPDCADWAYMIETKTIDRQRLTDTIEQVTASGADVVVLGCTHYHWIERLIKQLAAGRAQVIQPEQAVISQLKQVLSQLA